MNANSRSFLKSCLLLVCVLPVSGRAADAQPDPLAVQNFGPAYRYPQSGWTVVHIEGGPYERGVQHGRLLGPEIEAFVRSLAADSRPETAEGDWRMRRSYINSMFLRRFSQEQLQEMQGIADGAAAVGAQYSGRPLDLMDIVMINMSPELEAMDQANSATPSGLEDFHPPEIPIPPRPTAIQRSMHCAAFAANGPATRDGKIVFGHITMYDLRCSCYFNIWLDLKPTDGHRFVMQTVPGGIYSTMNYSISDTGIMMGETNISQTTMELNGKPMASRVRQVVQYAENVEQAASFMTENSNGLGSSEWVLADLKRNETGLLVLGTQKSKLYLSRKHEWIDGAEGFYWSCNNGKDMAVRLESMASMKSFPAAVAAKSASRPDSLWLKFHEQNKGRIDGDVARTVFNNPALVTTHSVDAVYTTAEMGLKMQSWACFGPTVGFSRQATFSERQQFPGIRPLIVNPWTVLDTRVPPPARAATDQTQAADLHDPVDGGFPGRTTPPAAPPMKPIWHGTLLPESDADIWLANGFANYHPLAIRLKFLMSGSAPDPAAMDGAATGLFNYRSTYAQALRDGEDVPLSKIHADYHSEEWFKIATGKGGLLLHSLRQLVGGDKFDSLMDEFGQANAGKTVSSKQFQAFIEKGTHRSWSGFFDAWLNRPGLPMLELGEVRVKKSGNQWQTSVKVRRNVNGAPIAVSVTVETTGGETTSTARLENAEDTVELVTDTKPLRVVLDKYRLSACGNGSAFTIQSLDADLEHAMILYGTLDETDANREAARMLQEVLRKRKDYTVVPIKADSAATEEDLKSHHLILIGNPSTNRIAARFRDQLPLNFGTRSLEIRGTSYANPDTAVVAASANPLNPRFSMTLFAGLGTTGLIRIMPELEEDRLDYAPFVLLPTGQPCHGLVPAPKEFIRTIPDEGNGK